MKSKLLFFIIPLAGVLSSTGVKAQQPGKLSLEKIWNSREYSAEGMSGLNSMKNGKSYSLLEVNKETRSKDINQYSYQSGKKEKVLVDGSKLKNAKGDKLIIESYQMSSNEKYMLLQSDADYIYRHSFIASYHVLELSTGKLVAVSNDKVMHATFSPDGKKVAFLKNNNLWYYDTESSRELQISPDGERNSVINGSCDWVYEEEFSFTRAYEWSPNSDVIGYYRFDESKVKEFSMTTYESLYPSEYKYKYPKAGEGNSEVSIRFYHLNGGKHVIYDFGNAKDFYVPRLKWTASNQYAIVYFMNRLQNELSIYKADVNEGKGTLLLQEKNKYYIDIPELTFTADGKYFIRAGEQDGHNHLYLYHANGGLANQITTGDWDVDVIAAIDEKKKLVYYTSSEISPMDRQLYSISFDGKKKTRLSKKAGYHSVSFNADKSLYIDNCSDMNTPAFISLHKAKGEQVRVLKTNDSLNIRLRALQLNKAEFFSFKTTYGGSLNGWMIKPPDFNSAKTYPVLMFVYGGPGHQTVVDRWGGANYLWYQYLAQSGYIVVSVDNRGTGFRGEEFKKCTYLELGKKETEDQIEAAKYLGSLGYVDKSRIGIFGWSYGGYMSSLCITKGADYFKAAVAVAPVTNWRYYDNIYTERYMRTPQENGKNYDDNSPISHVDKLRGKYLIIHGTADDNVHFQNSVEMVNALIRANKKFDSEYYPNRNHSIGGGNARLHIFGRISDFIFNNL